VRTALTVPRTTKAVPKKIIAKKINRTHILGYLKHFITLNYACQRNSGLPHLETIGFRCRLAGLPAHYRPIQPHLTLPGQKLDCNCCEWLSIQHEQRIHEKAPLPRKEADYSILGDAAGKSAALRFNP
jgi:hypothetical protein